MKMVSTKAEKKKRGFSLQMGKFRGTLRFAFKELKNHYVVEEELVHRN